MSTSEDRRNELKRIYERDGCLRPSAIVKEARPRRAVLHNEFEWDDKVAGHEYRLGQARKLIRITVLRDDTGAESRFVHIPPTRVEGPTAATNEREGVYKPICKVVQEPSDYEKALRELISRRNAMDSAIRELQRAARKEKKQPDLLVQLVDALDIAKRTLHLMSQAT